MRPPLHSRHWRAAGHLRRLRHRRRGRPSLAPPDTAEKHSFWRLRWTAGAGIEVPIAASWTARIECLLAEFGGHSVSFPAGGQKFDADYTSHTVRAGLNYRLGGDASKKEVLLKDGLASLETENFHFHAQATFLGQYASPFRAPYRGQNSLTPNQARQTSEFG